jgi:hypothetical protein
MYTVFDRMYGSFPAQNTVYFPVNQGCSVQSFGNKSSTKFVKVLEFLNCLSSSMCNSDGFCGHARPKYSSFKYI